MDTTDLTQLPLTTPSHNLKLKKIKYENFKTFQKLEVELSDFNILVGTNNSGKTNILLGIYSFFEFLKQLYSQHEDLKVNDSKANCEYFFLKVPEDAQIWYNKKWMSRKYIPVKFEFEFTDGLLIELHLYRYFGVPSIKLINLNKTLDKDYIRKILNSSPIMIPSFIGLLINEEYSTRAIRNQFISEGRSSEVLRNTLYDLEKRSPENYKLLKELLMKYFNIDLHTITFEEDIDPYITCEYKEENTSLDLICGGSGFLQILHLLTFILTKSTSIILLDEPDAHLHPHLQKILISILYDFQKRLDLQIILSTHSKDIINSIDFTHIIPISKDNTLARGLNTYFESLQLMSELGPIDNIDLALVIKTKKLLFIEGKSDKIIKQLAEISGYNLFVNNPYVIISRGGVDKNHYYEESKLISEFIDSKIKVFSIIDRDFRSVEESDYYIENSKKHQVDVFILDKKEIENYLIVPQLVMRCINESRIKRGLKQLSQEDVNNMLNEICESMKESTIDKYSQSLLAFNRKIDKKCDLTLTNPIARDIVAKKWTDLNGKISCCDGSDILNEINKKMSPNMIVINIGQLLSNISKEEISNDLIEIFKKLQ
ncbi:MAG: hypothetical protein EAX96_21485 [Candidatus Lokiarchaeota archaeon]|nr:hypothetical protein [Candidatus Lokiarchaeota archaeon]